MAESMLGLKRSHRCAEVVNAPLESEVTVMGWVQKNRNKGGIIFCDLRDRSGILQIIFEEEECGSEVFNKAMKLKQEFCIAVTGILKKRSGAFNDSLETGELEVRATGLRILSESETPPFHIEEDSILDNVSLFDFKQKYFPNLLVCIIKRGDEIIIPSGNNFIKGDDRIYITGSNSEIIKFQDALGKDRRKIKSAFIIGAGIISHYLAEELLKDKIAVKIVEMNPKKANKFSESLPGATIINADGSNEEVLKEENFQNYDSCISITGIDEINMFISIYAKKIGIKKIITKLNKLSFVDILGENSFQSIITPKKIIADNIVRVVRSIANKKKTLIENFYRLENNAVEAIEILVNSDSKINNIPLKDLKIKKNLLIAYIVRNNVAIFPKGTDVINEGDRVIIITTESFFDDINNIIAE